ncbi:MAG: hypothetical protein KDD66_15195, partial [Bdellovibrionales bacterium]|nr:hypothetical protein [Bdellovibrionales bacterium]
NGPVIGACRVGENDELMLITTSGNAIRIPASSVSLIGRNTQGVRLISLKDGETVGAVARVAEQEEENGEDEDALDVESGDE